MDKIHLTERHPLYHFMGKSYPLVLFEVKINDVVVNSKNKNKRSRNCRRPLRRKGSIEQRFWSRNLSMARSLKFMDRRKTFHCSSCP